jgi:maltose operon protein
MVSRPVPEHGGWTARAPAARRLALALALIGLVASCASPQRRVDAQGRIHFDPRPEDLERLRSAPVCCRTFAQFPFEPLDLRKGGKVTFRIDHASPAFNFESGKSYFKAFSLPPVKHHYEVTVQSYLPRFANAALTLDANFRIASTQSAPDRLMFRAEGYRFPLTYLDRGVLISPADRYLIILTTDELLRRATVTRETLKLGLGESTSTYVNWHRPTGELSIIQLYPSE